MENGKSTLYFAVYVAIGGYSKDKSLDLIAQYKNMIEVMKQEESEYNEKYYIIPIERGDSRIELIYPSPFLTEYQVAKYFKKYKEILDNK